MKTEDTTKSHALLPDADSAGVEALLESGFVEGIGKVFAHRLIDSFGADALKAILDEPEKVAKTPGIGGARVEDAARSLRDMKATPAMVAFLFSCGLNEATVEKIISKYRKHTENEILNDPYDMVENVWRLSFFTADKIGKRLGIAADDPRRLRGAVLTAVKLYAEAGHLFATKSQTIRKASEISGVSGEGVHIAIESLKESGRLKESRGGLYLPVYYDAEKQSAAKISELAAASTELTPEDELPETDEYGHTYSARQREAIATALNNPVSVLTGGPGTGKTTVLKGIIDVLRKQGKNVIQAAPTGRAAKRMETLTGHPAQTIHRLLGYRQGEGYHNKRLDADVLIIDEGSMLEQVLFNHLLQSLEPGSKIIIVGDTDQLPAIGAGDVLRDMINSGKVPVVTLNENFRQSAGSLIASGAHSINSGDIPESDPEGDFIIVPEITTARIHKKILDLVTEELPAMKGIKPSDILVVTPQQMGPLGARRLNSDLQARINPSGPELCRGTTVMRRGDPVMQTANSHQRGVYNGEMGKIVNVDTGQQTLEVEFSGARRSVYNRSELSELTLGYATTVHKLQGSETDYMVMPVTLAHKPMLYRNLIYTGVSRASRLCVLVGEEEALRYAVGNVSAAKRNSNFGSRL